MNRTKLIESTIAVALGIFSVWMSIYTIGFSAALAIPQWLNGPMQSIGSDLSMFLWSLLVVYPLGVGLLILLALWMAKRFPIQNPRLFCLAFAVTLCATYLIYSFWNGNGYSPLLILMWSSSYCIVVIAMVLMAFSLFRLGRD